MGAEVEMNAELPAPHRTPDQDSDGIVREEYAFLLALRPGRSYYQSVPKC